MFCAGLHTSKCIKSSLFRLRLRSLGKRSGIPATEFRQSEHDLFRLQVLKPLIVDVAYPLMPQVDIRLDFLSFREHGGAYVIGVKDEHPPISAPLRNNLAFFLDKAPEMREPDLHPLVDDLSDRNCRDV